MKLSDIDETLSEAPVGKLQRAATKLKKHTPFNKDARDRARGEDITQLAANELGSAFQQWLGRTKASGVNPNALTIDQLAEFFTGEGFAKTAAEVMDAAAKQKIADARVKDAARGNDREDDGAGVDYTDQANAHLNKKKGSSQNVPGYGQVNINAESLEYRLASKLLEDDDGYDVTFTSKEVEQMILKIVGSVGRENPKGLEARVKGTQGDDESSAQSSSSPMKQELDPNEIAEIKQKLDEMGEEIFEIIRLQNGVDDKIKKEMKNKIEDLIIDWTSRIF